MRGKDGAADIYPALQYIGGKRLMDELAVVHRRAEGIDGYSLKTRGEEGMI